MLRQNNAQEPNHHALGRTKIRRSGVDRDTVHMGKLVQLGHYLSFFFNDTAPTEIYTLSLHDALPICPLRPPPREAPRGPPPRRLRSRLHPDRKSTRLNSSHGSISYAVFCLKKKKRRDSLERFNNEDRDTGGQ